MNPPSGMPPRFKSEAARAYPGGVGQLVHTKKELAESLAKFEGDVALVMTMGALHDGHMSLVRAAKEVSPNVVVSIFVNPLQFGPGEDYEAYPRDLDADMELLSTVGVDLVYAPTVEDMYPREPLVRIEPGPAATILEGKTRPTHFAGVLQVVHKVFNLVRPRMAFFGQKDAQQLALIRTMVADLDMPVDIRAVPIKRTDEGLALSSRNSYLSENEKIQALALHQALAVGRDSALRGLQAMDVLAAARKHLESSPGVKIDYVELVDPQTFVAVEHTPADGMTALLVTAAWVGSTRLIDNMEVELRG